MYSWAKPDRWVKILATKKRGCIRAVDERGRLSIAIPSENDWPFPTRVFCDIDSVVPVGAPKKPKAVHNFEEALL